MATHIVVTGNVAVGKSHITKVISHHLPSSVIYPEFIYRDSFAMELLRRRFIEHSISALTFQNFIMDKWLNLDKQQAGDINVYERLPADAVEVFAKMSLPPDQYAIQQQRLQELTLPDYSLMRADDTVWITYENDFKKSLSPLLDKLDELIGKVTFIVIEVKSRTAFENYQHRDRHEEIYTREQIAELQIAYDAYLEEKRLAIGCTSIDL